MDLKRINLAVVWTLICLMVSDIGSALFANKHLWKPLRFPNFQANVFKGHYSTPFLKALNPNPPYAEFLNEQCEIEKGRDLVTLLVTKEKRFCEKYDSKEECEWCALGKVRHDCLKNRQDLEDLVRRFMDYDENNVLSVPERKDVSDPIDYYQLQYK